MERIILTAEDIPANSVFTPEEMQSVVDEMQSLDTDSLVALREWLDDQRSAE